MSVNTALQHVLDVLRPEEAALPLSPADVRFPDLSAAIDGLEFPEAGSVRSGKRAIIALKAGLQLFNGDLDRSHRYSQQIEDDATGSYWHGIMHRMEGDYSNSNYWFRQAGNHPSMQQLAGKARERLSDPSADLNGLPPGAIRDSLIAIRDGANWNAPLLTDSIARQEQGSGSAEARACLESLQHIEMLELLDYTLEAAAQPR